jgi:hypothetical protein
LEEYPQVEAAYNDYKQKTMAARGDEWYLYHSLKPIKPISIYKMKILYNISYNYHQVIRCKNR